MGVSEDGVAFPDVKTLRPTKEKIYMYDRANLHKRLLLLPAAELRVCALRLAHCVPPKASFPQVPSSCFKAPLRCARHPLEKGSKSKKQMFSVCSGK